MAKWTTEQLGDQSGRVAVVTGANSGIGFWTAAALAANGAHVVLACRSEERGSAALGRIRDLHADAKLELMIVDLSDLDSVRRFATAFREAHDRLDLLINNAGVMIPPFTKTAQGFELQIGVNHLGHFALTDALLESVVATEGARIVNVASTAHRGGAISFDDLNWERRGYSAWRAYGQSKLANLLFSLELSTRLAEAGHHVLVTSAHPGYTSTNLQKNMPLNKFFNANFAMPEPQGALPTLRAAVDPDADANDYYGPDGFFEMFGFPKKVGRTKAARNEDDAKRLWELSAELTGATYEALTR